MSARPGRAGTVRLRLLRALASLATCAALAAGPRTGAATPSRRTIVATTSILGAVVREVAGADFDVKVAIPNGLDPHEWEPSARDIETLTHADLIVANGLGLEGGIQRTLDQARRGGVRFFTAGDHITIRKVGPGEGIPSGDPDQVAGARDPHLWTDPLTMKAVARALATELRTDFGIDLSARLADLENRLDRLDAEIQASLAAIPPEDRKLVTGHESMGYFAQRYRFKLVGAVVPSLSSQAESSAAGLGALKELIARNGVKVLFTELGTPPRVTEVLAREAGVRCVTLTTHSLPADGSYLSFMRALAGTIASNLRVILDLLVSPFVHNGFMASALAAGLLVSLACGIVGTFVVLRGLAFIGDALAHGVLPGVAISMLLGLPGLVGAAVGTAAMILGIGFITRRSRLSSDTAIGLLFVGMLALGVAIVSRSGAFSGDLVRILFGEILGVTRSEILLQLVATALIAAVAYVCRRPFLLLCFNPEQADTSGFSSKRFHGIMLALIALTVVVSFRTVGTLLVFGMLLAPAATAALFSRRIGTMVAVASAIGAVSVYAGLLASYHADTAAGASITLVATLVFFASLIGRQLLRRQSTPAAANHAHAAEAQHAPEPRQGVAP